jgi:hypothetical protein
LAELNHLGRTTDPAFSVLIVRAWKQAVLGNQSWERPKDRLVHWPLQALLAAVINISILSCAMWQSKDPHRTFLVAPHMSAFEGKAVMADCSANVCF